MPTFDLITSANQMPNAVGGYTSDAPLQIRQQGVQALEQGVGQVVDSTVDLNKRMDEADMANAHSAMLNLKSAEQMELDSVVNPEDVPAIQEKYRQKYDEIMTGVEPVSGKKYFRNESGRNAFQKGFMDSFQTKRGIEGKQKMYDLNRRDTQAKYMRAIKSVIDEDGWDTPLAERRINTYVTKLQEDGFIGTNEEAKQFREDRLKDLDTERANKMFANMEQYDYTEGRTESDVKGYKARVNDLKHLTQEQKNDYNKKADSMLKYKKASFKAFEQEAKIKKQKDTNDYAFNTYFLKSAQTGEMDWAKFYNDPNISEDLKQKNLSNYAKYNQSKRDAEAQAKLAKSAQDTSIKVLNYNPSYDDTGRKKTELSLEIINNVGDATMRSFLMDRLNNQNGLNESQKLEYQNVQKEIARVFGTDAKLTDGKVKDPYGRDTDDEEGFEVEDGQLFFKNISMYKNRQMAIDLEVQWTNLMKAGKPNEAQKVLSEGLLKAEQAKTNNDLYQSFIQRDLVKKQYK